MSGQQSRSGPVALGVALAVAGAGLAGFLALAPSDPVEAPAAVAAPNQVVRAPVPSPAPSPAPNPGSASAPNAAVDPGVGKLAAPPNRLARDLQREQIWRSLARKHALEPAQPGSAAPTEEAAAKLPALDREYIRTAIKEQLVPVAIDCYESVLERNADARGRVVLEFTIIGDADIGGVVEEVALGDGSTLDDAFLRECLGESLLAVTFPAPREGGRVEVHYPLDFAPDSPED